MLVLVGQCFSHQISCSPITYTYVASTLNRLHAVIAWGTQLQVSEWITTFKIIFGNKISSFHTTKLITHSNTSDTECYLPFPLAVVTDDNATYKAHQL